ncbi:MAG: ATP-binding protein [Selenomonadaceae bacterium]|nr:ATP-binding protein [Selenomonadaceae bacterium]
MNPSEVAELAPVGSKVQIIFHGETVDGTVKDLMESSIVLRKSNGRIKAIIYEKIEGIEIMDEDVPNEPPVKKTPPPPVPTVPAAQPKVNKEILPTPLIFFTQPSPVSFMHRDYIKSRIKEYRDSNELRGFDAEWNQLDNAFEDAKKNNSLAEKQDQILRQLKDFVSNYPSEPANIFAGDVYSAFNDWARAALSYAKGGLYPEAVTCAMKITDSKNLLIEVLRRQLLDKDERTPESLRMFFYYAAEAHYHKVAAELIENISNELTNVEREFVCQGCYKILADSGNATALNWDDFDYSYYGLEQLVETLKRVGQNDPPFNLPELNGEQAMSLVTAVKKGKLTLFKQQEHYGFIDTKVFFHLGQVEDENLRAALNQFGLWRKDIRVTYILGEAKPRPAADHIKLVAGEELPPDATEVHNGVLDTYSVGFDFGRVIDSQSGNSYGFKIDTVLDPCLRRYLQDNFVIEPLHVQFTLKFYKEKEVIRRMRLIGEELHALSQRYGMAVPIVQPSLNDDILRNLPPYKPLPPLHSSTNNIAIPTIIPSAGFDNDSSSEPTTFENDSSPLSAYSNFEDDDLPLSAYAKYMVEQINLKTYFTSKRRIFKGKFDNEFDGDNFLGTPESAVKIRIEIIDSIKASSDEERRKAWGFVLKLSEKVYSRFSYDSDRCDTNRISPFWQHCYAAQLMGYAGDTELQQLLDCNVDVARFFYNEEMAMTPKGSNIDTRAYFVKLLASFFIEPNAVSQLKTNTPAKDMNVHLSYLKNDIISLEPQRLLVSTFLITDKMSTYISEFLEEMSKSQRWRVEAESLFNRLMPEQLCILTEDNFKKSYWPMAKKAYLRKIEKFVKILRDAAENYNNTGESGLDSLLEEINDMLESDLLAVTDRDRIKHYSELLRTMSKIADKNTFEDKEEEYKKVIDKSGYLMTEICKKPTKLSYETLYEAIETLHFKAEDELKKLYESSVPELTIETDILGAAPVEFFVTVENKENCQTAGNMEVEVTGIGGKVEFKATSKKIRAVRGGDQKGCSYEADLGENEKSQGYFEVTIRVTYRYRVARDETIEKSIERNENIPLLTSEDYEEIKNDYENLSGKVNGVPVESNLFYGRDEDISKIVKMLRLTDGSMLKHYCLVMYGQKRAGKTSIMNHLTGKIQEAYGKDTYVIVDIGSVGECQSFYGFLSAIIRGLEEILYNEHKDLYDFLLQKGVTFPYGEIESNSSEDARQGAFTRTLRDIISKSREFCGSDDKYIPLFLIDEFTYFYQWIKDGTLNKNFMKFWKAFMQNNPICAIVIGMDHMPQFIDEYQNEFACLNTIPVHFLKENDTKDLANKPILLEDGSSRYKGKPGEDALNYIYRLTAGSAYLTVIFCEAFVDYLNKRKTTYITRTVIDNFIREKLLGTHPVLDKINFEPQLKDPGKFSTKESEATIADNKTVLTHIAVYADKGTRELSRDKINCIDELSEKTEERLDIIIDQLERRHVLTKRAVNHVDYYKIEIELLHMWLRREVGEDF